MSNIYPPPATPKPPEIPYNRIFADALAMHGIKEFQFDVVLGKVSVEGGPGRHPASVMIAEIAERESVKTIEQAVGVAHALAAILQARMLFPPPCKHCGGRP